MSQTSDTTTGNGGNFDPRQAAALLDQTTQRARRQFTPGPPLLWVFRSVVVLVGLGACWLSVRGQRPYTGPTGPALAVLFALVAANIGLSTWTIKHAAAGVSGPAQRAWRIWAGVMLVVLIGSYAFMAPAYHAGASHPQWGLYPASGPLLIVGLVGAVATAARRDWTISLTMLAIAAAAAIAGFGGPVGSWLIMAVGLCVVCLGTAALRAQEERHNLVRS